MAVNRVDYGTQTLIDLTSDTVTPETLVAGATAHDKAGNAITGTAPAVQTYTGTFTTDSNGEADVNVGFKPDFVTILIEGTRNISGFEQLWRSNICIDLYHINDGELQSTVVCKPDDSGMLETETYPTQNGFYTYIANASWSWKYSVAANTEFSFVAVKYT